MSSILRKAFLSSMVFLLLCMGAALSASYYEYHPNILTVTIIDSFENMLNGYYTSHGLIPYRDFAANHFPGLYFYLGLIFKIFSVTEIPPSQNLMDPLQYSAYFSTYLFQEIMVFAALAILRVPLLINLITSCLLVYILGNVYNFMFPLSETFLVYCYMLLPVLMYRSIYSSDAHARSFFSIILLIFFPLFTNFIGLTFAPTCMIICAFAAWNLYRDKALDNFGGIILNYRGYCALLTFGLISVMIALFALTDLSGLYFYNFPFNAILKPESLSILNHVIWQFKMSWYGLKPFLFYLPTTVLLLVALMASHPKRPMRMHAIMVITLFLAACFCLWRFQEGYKTYGVLGINIGIIFILICQFSTHIINFSVNVPASLKSPLTLGIIAVLTWNIYVSTQAKFWEKFRNDGPIVFHDLDRQFQEAGVCKFGQDQANCQCLRLTTFDPLLFVHHNLGQCKPSGIWIPNMAFHEHTMDELRKNVASNLTAFLVYDANVHQTLNFPEESLRNIRESRYCFQAYSRTLCSSVQRRTSEN